MSNTELIPTSYKLVCSYEDTGGRTGGQVTGSLQRSAQFPNKWELVVLSNYTRCFDTVEEATDEFERIAPVILAYTRSWSDYSNQANALARWDAEEFADV